VRNTFPELRLLPREGWLDGAPSPVLSGVPETVENGARLAMAGAPLE
jgi:hypothetical protein